MRRTRRLWELAVPLLTVTALAACTSSDDEVAREGGAQATEPGVYGAPVDPSVPDPVDVATDAPVTPAPTMDGSLFVTHSGWNTDAEAVEVGSYFPQVVETDGTCTLTLTRGTASVTASSPANRGAGSTSCGNLSVPGAELASGTWTAVVTYSSSSSRAASEPVEVDVP